MRLKKNQLAIFHVHELSDKAIDYIVTHCNAIALINTLEKRCEVNSLPEIVHYSFMDREKEILEELKEKVDIFDASEV